MKDNNETKKFPLLKYTALSIRELFSFDKKIFVHCSVYAVAAMVSPLMSTLLLKALLDAIESKGKFSEILISVLVFVAVSGFVNILMCIMNAKSDTGDYLFRYHAMRRVLGHAMEIPYEYIENREKRTYLDKAYLFLNTVGTIYVLRGILSNFLGVFSVCSVFLFVDYKICILLLVVGICTFILHFDLSEKIYKDTVGGGNLLLKEQYLMSKPSQIKAAKDIKIYNLSSWFSPMVDVIIGDRIVLIKSFMRYFSRYKLIDAALIFVRDGLVLYFLISSVLKGKFTVSDFAFLFGVVNTFSLWVTDMAYRFGTLKSFMMGYRDYLEFMNIKTYSQEDKADFDIDPHKPLSVEFKNVRFSYNEEKTVIKNISFNIKSGEKIAIVGENGSGKTTCMKLLCGLYNADEGDILVNGISIDDLPSKQKFSLFSAVFQDAFVLPASIKENIALSEEIDYEKLEKSAEMSGIGEKVAELHSGMDTLLNKELNENGIELSGGELQKMFLARALYKDAPIVILDEPTAALDPIAESELYTKFNSLTKDKTAFYISHRLSSTRFCDRIIFLKDGEITETGTHGQLMELKGDYFKMYEMQSYYYKEERDYDL